MALTLEEQQHIRGAYQYLENVIIEGESAPRGMFGGISFIQMQPRQKPVVDEEYTRIIESSLARLLAFSPSTKKCKEYLQQEVMALYRAGLGSQALEYTRIMLHLDQGEHYSDLAFFDAAKTPNIERELYQFSSEAEILGENDHLFSAWAQEFQQTHGQSI